MHFICIISVQPQKLQNLIISTGRPCASWLEEGFHFIKAIELNIYWTSHWIFHWSKYLNEWVSGCNAVQYICVYMYRYMQWFFSSVKLGNDKVLMFTSLVHHLYIMLAKNYFNNMWYIYLLVGTCNLWSFVIFRKN